MNLLDLMVKVDVDDKASEKISSLASGMKDKLGGAAATVAKGVGAGVAAVGAASAAVAKSSLESYAAYEQNVGGIQKLFGNMGKSLEEYAELTGQAVDQCADKWETLQQSQAMVLDNASNAWQTAGMSANQYMEQVTGFSAALVSSLGGDTVKAAEYANMAMVDMSDNANTFGTDMQSIQWAYQGFAKQNYTMLDNLKLGYGGTQEEMKRLIADASQMTDVQEKLGVTVDESSMSFDNCVAAIHVMQESMQIGGTTAREAATTIEGSVNSMKAAWENWKTGLADDDADMGQLTDNLVQSFETAADNVVPRIGIILGTLIGTVPGLVAEVGPALAESLADTIGTAASTVFEALPDGAQQALNDTCAAIEASGLDTKVADMLGRAGESIASFLGLFDEAGFEVGMQEAADFLVSVLDLVDEKWSTFAELLGPVIGPVLESAGAKVMELGQAFQDAQVWMQPLAEFFGGVLAEAVLVVITAFELAVTVITGVISGITGFVAFLGEVPGNVSAFVGQVTSFFGELPGNIANFISSIIQAIAEWVTDMASQATEAASNFGSNLINGLMELPARAMEAGQAIVQGIIDGITGMIGAAGEAIGSVMDTIASFLPHSPAKRGALSGKGWSLYSGRAIVSALAEGMQDEADKPEGMASKVMAGISGAMAAGKSTLATKLDAIVGGQSGGRPVVINMDGARLNDDESLREAAYRFLVELLRVNNMREAM